jgi:hypothetical protein
MIFGKLTYKQWISLNLFHTKAPLYLLWPIANLFDEAI